MPAFLADECVSSQTIQLIKSLGFVVETLHELCKQGLRDEEVLKVAQEKKSTLVTYDRGFGDLARYDACCHSGIVVIKAHDSDSLRRCHGVLEMLLRTEDEFEQMLFIVDGGWETGDG